MFVLQQEPRWTWPVKIAMPAEGGFAEHRCRAVFRLVAEPRRKQLAATDDGLRTIMAEAVVELLDIVDEAGAPVPHSPALLAAVLDNPWIRGGLVTAYGEALSGIPSAAAEGN